MDVVRIIITVIYLGLGSAGLLPFIDLLPSRQRRKARLQAEEARINAARNNSRPQPSVRAVQSALDDEKHDRTITNITDDAVPELVRQGYENALKREANSPNPKFHRTEREDELAYNFCEKHGDVSSKKTDEFEHLYELAFQEGDTDTKIVLLQKAIRKFEEARNWHYRISKGGKLYFQDMWEHLHNSRNLCFSRVDQIRETLEYEIRMKEYVKPGVVAIVSENPGILQKNIYALLDKASKSDIQRVLKEYENQGVVRREKSGGSYKLTMQS
jgi:hypothetical protein